MVILFVVRGLPLKKPAHKYNLLTFGQFARKTLGLMLNGVCALVTLTNDFDRLSIPGPRVQANLRDGR